MAVLNTLPPRFESLIIAFHDMGNEDRLFTLDFVINRFLQKDQRCEMRDHEMVRSYCSFALVNVTLDLTQPPIWTRIRDSASSGFKIKMQQL